MTKCLLGWGRGWQAKPQEEKPYSLTFKTWSREPCHRKSGKGEIAQGRSRFLTERSQRRLGKIASAEGNTEGIFCPDGWQWDWKMRLLIKTGTLGYERRDLNLRSTWAWRSGMTVVLVTDGGAGWEGLLSSSLSQSPRPGLKSFYRLRLVPHRCNIL